MAIIFSVRTMVEVNLDRPTALANTGVCKRILTYLEQAL